MTNAQDVLKDVPRERWAGALAMLLLKGFTDHPDVLLALVVQGEARFVAVGVATDRHGLTKGDYRQIYRRLARAATRLGYATRIQ